MANTGDTLEQALARVREGDVEAFAQVVAAYHVSIRAYLAAAVADWAVADDLAQQTFVFAFEHVADYRPGSNCLAWLRTVARFKVLSYRRRQRQVRDKERRYWQQEVLDQTVDAVGSEVIDQRLEAMTDCIARLPDAQR